MAYDYSLYGWNGSPQPTISSNTDSLMQEYQKYVDMRHAQQKPVMSWEQFANKAGVSTYTGTPASVGGIQIPDTSNLPANTGLVRLPSGEWQQMKLDEGSAPFFGRTSDGTWTATTNPDVISEWKHDQTTRGLQSAAQIAAMIGGGTLASNMLGPTGAGSTAVSTPTAATTAAAPATTGTSVGLPAASGFGGTAGGVSSMSGVYGTGATAAGATGGGLASKIGSAVKNMATGDGKLLETVLGTVGSLFGGKMQSDAAGKAVDAQVQASRETIDFLKESRDLALNEMKPYTQASQQALAQMLRMQGINPGPELLSALGDADPGDYNFQTDPGYQFRIKEAQRVMENSAAARGGLMNGRFQEYMTDRISDYASSEWQNSFNRLSTTAGYGTPTQNANVIQGTASNVGNVMTDTGAARGSGYIAQGNAWANALNNIGHGIAGWENLYK